MALYLGMSHADIKAECRRYSISVCGKKRELEQRLGEALIKRTQDKLHKWATAMPRTFYPSMSLVELRTELMARRLPISGTKGAAVKKLRDADWKAWDSRLQTFPQFAKLPVEIQEYIWQYSLPGPRVLSCAYLCPEGPDGLHFPRGDHTPNPAALTTCSLSRNIALKRYCLVFGMKNIYADLEGGDILYIHCLDLFLYSLSQLWRSENSGICFPAAVTADLEKVTHLLLGPVAGFFYASPYRYVHGLQDHEITTLRTNLLRLKSLKTLSLSCGGSNPWVKTQPPGQTYVEYDIMKFKSMDVADYFSCYHKAVAVTIKSHLYDNPTEEEISRGIPDCQLVEVYRIPDAPSGKRRDNKEDENLELYYDRPEEHWKG